MQKTLNGNNPDGKKYTWKIVQMEKFAHIKYAHGKITGQKIAQMEKAQMKIADIV